MSFSVHNIHTLTNYLMFVSLKHNPSKSTSNHSEKYGSISEDFFPLTLAKRELQKSFIKLTRISPFSVKLWEY